MFAGNRCVLIDVACDNLRREIGKGNLLPVGTDKLRIAPDKNVVGAFFAAISGGQPDFFCARNVDVDRGAARTDDAAAEDWFGCGGGFSRCYATNCFRNRDTV
jgi:hypothetical protein